MHARSIPGPESSLMQSLSGRTVNAQAIRHADGSIKEGGTNRDSSPSRTIQNRIDSLKSITPPALPEVDVSNMPMLTVDGLKAAWGETDSVYDLNSDGTVNVNDLLKLLAEGGTMHHPDAPITIEGVMLAMESGNLAYDVNKDGQVNVSDLLQVLAAQGEKGQASLDNMPLLTVDGLKAAWGETDSIYDLDSDGTVNVNDLLKLLAEGGTIHHPDAPITVEGVKLAMESGNLAYDVNKDGQVNVSDLLQVLADQGKASNAGASARETSPSDPKARFIDHNMASRPLPKEELEERTRIALGRPAFEPVSSSFAESVARERQEMQRLSESLYDRFLKNGFALKPPANLHAILDQFELPRPDRQHLLEQLTDRYPQGLGVNRVG